MEGPRKPRCPSCGGELVGVWFEDEYDSDFCDLWCRECYRCMEDR